MAYESASDWLGALDRTFSSAAQPLIAYNLEKRRVAERDLLRQRALQDEARQRGYALSDLERNRQAHLQDVAESQRFSTEQNLMANRVQEQRDIEQRSHAERMQKSAQEAAINLHKSEWERADKATKDAILRDLRAKADKLGIPPSPSADFDASFDYYNRKVNEAQASSLVEFTKQGDMLRQELSNLTESTLQERSALQMNILLGPNYADATKVLTPSERLALQKNPGAILEIEHRLASDRSKKGKAEFEAFDQAVNESDAQAEAIYLKRPSASRERVEIIKNRMMEHRELGKTLFKDAMFGPDTITQMYKGMVGASKPATSVATAASVPGALPPPSAIFGTPATTDTTTPDGIPVRGILPFAASMIGSGAGAVAQEAKPFVRSGMIAAGDVASGLFGGTIRNPMSPFFPQSNVQSSFIPTIRPWGAFQGQVIPPQLEQYLTDEAVNRALSTPIAYPPYKPLVPAPDETGVAIPPWQAVR